VARPQRGGAHIPAAVWNWLRAHGYHLVFGLTLVLLAALVSWWTVFILHAIEQQREYHFDSALDSARIRSFAIGHNRNAVPPIGRLADDERLEIVECGDHGHSRHAILAPFWPDYCIALSPDYVAAGEQKFHRQLLMVAGEGSVLLLAILVCSFMLYRVIFLERRAAKQLREFWNRVTHELKTPITGIKAFLQTLQAQDFSREELEPLVAMALREVERQEMLAENLLIGQRIAREGLGLRLRPFGLVQRVREFYSEHRILIPEGAFDLHVACSEGLQVTADPDALWVILENLTDNALKYGGDPPKITCVVEESAKHGIVRICDEGVGFDQADADRIFNAYQRLTTESPVGRHGTGMGLYLSRQLAVKMGGGLRAESAGPGSGACFIVTLKRVN
jgi:signal transduction histidine kinase